MSIGGYVSWGFYALCPMVVCRKIHDSAAAPASLLETNYRTARCRLAVEERTASDAEELHPEKTDRGGPRARVAGRSAPRER